jgi:hypothetical protein
LVAIPSKESLLKAYETLSPKAGDEGFWNPSSPSLSELSLLTQWARFDARLAQILVKWLSHHWKQIPAASLNQIQKEQPWPAALGPLLEFTRNSIAPSELSLFQKWRACALHDFKPAPYEQYFLGQRAAGGKEMFKDATQSLKPYGRWGYLSREILDQKKLARTSPTLLPIAQRRKTLTSLAKERKELKVSEYRELIGLERLSLRQAERDLKEHPMWKAWGSTRSRVYRSEEF